ncbi:hypothetical protein BS50DRAFT_577635 [Corynespora cassiicola Philippines]|uniref:C2H2-type domain-containing protein n=1 Tax=Corynespora cassiicola Philippines TaxID=1448308 RepID=A0A2T2NB96_CORCC|nr:hypothetical protein BS50DRAFT_577635 [Corynespora cassiicola Philippines]
MDLSTLLDMAPQVHENKMPQRSLPRRRSKYLLRRSKSGTRPISIPTIGRHAGDQSLAMQRWQNSPPEAEAASLSAIYSALHSGPENVPLQRERSQEALRRYRGPPSTTSLDSGASESSLQSGTSSASTSSQPTRATARSQRGRGMQKNSTAKTKNTADRIFKCTFCCDTFKHKYDWARHEKSLHLNMEEWQCTPHGGVVVMPQTGRVHCAYCNILDPTDDHLALHNHSACQHGGSTPRTFRRKDHLVQHLRLVHHLDTLPLLDDWKAQTAPIVSRCGFCNKTLNSWEERSDHLAAHFRSGNTMADWQGTHGFDRAVAARVTNSLAPYLIASEGLTIVPFSATNPASMDHVKQIASHIDRLAASTPPEVEAEAEAQSLALSQSRDPSLPSQQEIDTVTFTELLTRHLSRFARQQMTMGVIPTDEMFQRESRRVLYDDDQDTWNQTVADNVDWLDEFRMQNGWERE